MSDDLYDAIDQLLNTARVTGLRAVFTPIDSNFLEKIQESIDLNLPFITWYSVASPKGLLVPVGRSNLPIYGADDLLAVQEGYSFNAVTGEPIVSWDSTWIVFGGEGQYPLVTFTKGAQKETICYAQVTLQYNWQLVELSDDLEGFLRGVNSYLRLYILTYDRRIKDSNYMLLPNFRNDLETELNKIPSTSGRIDLWLHGWLGL